MGIIKNIKLDDIENGLKEIIGLSFQTKLFQEEYEDVMDQIKVNKDSFNAGDISKDVYDKNKVLLESERKRLTAKISETVSKIQKTNNSIQNLIRENKI